MAKVSILMAVYNAEQWLKDSLDSMLRQTYHDWQLICIDDASTDNSLAILHDYSQADSRIEVIALDRNGGLAHAKNQGLLRATGNYIGFLDSDDWLSDDALQTAVAQFESHSQTDVVLFHVSMVRGKDMEEYPMQPFEVLSGHDAFTKALDWQIHGIYMARAGLQHQYPYDETCFSYSDDNTTRLHYLAAREVRTCSGTYYYRRHAQSVSHHISVRRFDYLRASESMKKQLQELRHIDADVVARYENIRWLILVDVYMFYHVHGRQLPLADRQFGLNELHRAWESIDRRLLNKKTIAKFGYRPCCCWPLFRLQEWLYFTLRGFLGKNR